MSIARQGSVASSFSSYDVGSQGGGGKSELGLDGASILQGASGYQVRVRPLYRKHVRESVTGVWVVVEVHTGRQTSVSIIQIGEGEGASAAPSSSPSSSSSPRPFSFPPLPLYMAACQ
jgi:hypothetical protein